MRHGDTTLTPDVSGDVTYCLLSELHFIFKIFSSFQVETNTLEYKWKENKLCALLIFSKYINNNIKIS